MQTGVRFAFSCVFPVNARGQVLLQLRDDRPDLVAAGTWSTLGGMVEAGETPEEGARRELVEECGRDAAPLTHVADREYVWAHRGPVRVHFYAAAVDWSLDDLLLNEGQALAWFAPAEIATLRLSLIGEAILEFARSPLLRRLAAAAPPARDDRDVSPPRAFAEALGIGSGSLVALYGASASFAGRLRAVLPAGARLTATPGPDEAPDVTLWWPGRAGSTPARFLSVAGALTPGDILWVVVRGKATAALQGLWAAASAMRLAFGGTLSFGDEEEGARFVRRQGTHAD